MKTACLPAIVIILFLASAGGVLGDTYHFYHTLDDHGSFRVRVKSMATERYYTSELLSFRGRPWTIDLRDGKYELSRSSGRSWISLGTYELGNSRFQRANNNVYIGTGGWIYEDGQWRAQGGAPPGAKELTLAHGLKRIPYFGIDGEPYQNPPGVLVTWVKRDSAAQNLTRNGRTYYLEANVDVITHMNGQAVRDFSHVKDLIADSDGHLEIRAYDLRKREVFEYTADF